MKDTISGYICDHKNKANAYREGEHWREDESEYFVFKCLDCGKLVIRWILVEYGEVAISEDFYNRIMKDSS